MSQPIYSVYIKPPEISSFLGKLIQYKYWLAVNWALLTCCGTALYCLSWWNLFSLLNLISFWPHLDEIPFARLHLFHSLRWGCLFQLAGAAAQPKYLAVCNRREPATQSAVYKKDLGQHQARLLETFVHTGSSAAIVLFATTDSCTEQCFQKGWKGLWMVTTENKLTTNSLNAHHSRLHLCCEVGIF